MRLLLSGELVKLKGATAVKKHISGKPIYKHFKDAMQYL